MHLPLFRPPRLVRSAVVRSRQCFLITVLWHGLHVKTLSSLTHMRWGPADRSVPLGGCLDYLLSVVVWSVFEVANFGRLVLLF